MQSFGNVSLIARLIALAVLQALAVLGSSYEGNLDEVLLVQTHANVSNDMIGEHGLNFRMEDAESLFDLVTSVVRDPNMGSTLPEKGVALLQNLAKHHSVVNSGHQESLERAAESVKKEFAAMYSDESRAGASVGRLPDWHLVKDGKQGMCWDYHGGKPLQCKVPTATLDQITDFLPHLDKCQKLCFDNDWCSGYGYQPAPVDDEDVSNLQDQYILNEEGKYERPAQTSDEEFCTLMNNGAESCPDSWETFGVIPLLSSRDFTVRPAYTDVGDTGTDYDYKCYAKYKHDPTLSRLLSPGIFAFPQLAPVMRNKMVVGKGAKCMHSELDPQTSKNKPLHTCKMKTDDYAKTALTGFKNKGLNAPDKEWANACERICGGLDWCAGYTLMDEVGFPFSAAHPEECYLHSNLPDGCPEGHSWEIDRTRINARMAVETASDIVAGPPEKGATCKSKAQSYKGWFQDKLAPGPGTPLCYVSKGMQIGQAIMAVAYLVGNWDCAMRSDTESTARLADPKGRQNADAAARHGSNAKAAHLQLAAHPRNASAMKNGSRLAHRGHASRHRKSSPEGRAALANILGSDDKTDVTALKLSKEVGSKTCYLLTNGGSARWGLSSLAYFFTKQATCSEDPSSAARNRAYCQANLVRVLGRSLGAGVYGYASITQNCGADALEPRKFFCGVDYAKLVMYFGKLVFKVVYMAVFLNDDQKWERGAAGVDTAAAFVFIMEAIIRIMGPCLGKMKNNPAATKIEDGACIASYLEEVGLASYAMTSAVASYNYCVAKQ